MGEISPLEIGEAMGSAPDAPYEVSSPSRWTADVPASDALGPTYALGPGEYLPTHEVADSDWAPSLLAWGPVPLDDVPADQGLVAPDVRIVEAHFAEFLAGLAPDSVDLALTDPPYTISKATGFQNVKNGVERFAVSMDFGHWDHAQIDLDELARSLYRVLRKGGTAIIWYDIWKLTPLRDAMAAAGFKMLRLIFWQKTNPVPLNSTRTYLSNSREMAVVGVKVGKPTFHGEYDSGIYEYPIPRHNGNRIHPTQKSDALFAELIRKHSNPGDLVIDPFLGAGTTAIAALEEERRFAGCDIDPHYVAEARRRITDA